MSNPYGETTLNTELIALEKAVETFNNNKYETKAKSLCAACEVAKDFNKGAGRTQTERIMKTFRELEQLIVEWAEEVGIFYIPYTSRQMLKTVEELGELSEVIQNENVEGVIEELGDVVVTMILAAKMKGFSVGSLSLFSTYVAEDTPRSIEGVFLRVCHSVTSFYNSPSKPYLEMFHHSAGALALSYNLTVEQCLEHAYSKVSKRKGQMVKGIFVKEGY